MAINDDNIKNPYNSGLPQDIGSIVNAIHELGAKNQEIVNCLQQLQKDNKNNTSPINVDSKQLDKVLNDFAKRGAIVFAKEFQKQDKRTSETSETNKRFSRTSPINYDISENNKDLNRSINALGRDFDKVKDEFDRLNINPNLKELSNAIDSLTNSQQQKVDSKTIKTLQESLRNTLNVKSNLGSSFTELDDLSKNIRNLQVSRSSVSKEWDTFSTGIRDFIKPQESEDFKTFVEQFSSTVNKYQQIVEQLYQDKDILTKQQEENTQYIKELEDESKEIPKKLEEIAKRLEEANREFTQSKKDVVDANRLGFSDSDINELIKERTEKGDILAQIQEEAKNASIRKQQLEEQKKIINADNERIELELNELKEQTKFAENQKKNAEDLFKKSIQNENLRTKLIKSAIDTISKGITKMVTHELDLLDNAANTMFDSFEKMQNDIGKTLKMSSGAYQEFAEKMSESAKEAGVAIDASQLNEAAATMVEMGVTNENLIRGFAVGQAKITESGASIKLDEETVKQMQASYFRDIKNGMSEEDAYNKMQNSIDQMIAADQWIREQFGSTTALSTGGWEEMERWADRLMSTGDLQSENLGQFYANMGGFMQAMENQGMDSSVILQDLESALQGKQGELNTDLLKWFQTNNIGISTTEDLYKALGSEDFGKVATSYLGSQIESYQGLDALSAAYKSSAFGSSLTADQLRSIQSYGTEAVESFNENTPTQEDLNNIVDMVLKGISEGDYLSATEKLQKENLNKVTDIARNMQKVTEGKFWMDTGIDALKTGLSSLTSGLVSGIGNLITTKMLGGSGNVGTVGGTDGGTGGSISTNGTTGGMPSDVLTGGFRKGSSSQAKAAAAASIAIGAGITLDAIISDVKSSEDKGEAAEQIFTDPEFYTGVGTMLGAAAGGPIGAAVGGVIGDVSSNIGNAIAEPLSDYEIWYTQWWNTDLRNNMQQLLKDTTEYELMTEAANKLYEAGELHAQNAITEQSNLDMTKDWVTTADRSQKELWLIQNKASIEQLKTLSDEQILNNLSFKSDEEMNKYFEEILKQWYEDEKERIAQENLLAKSSDLAGSFENVIGIDNFTNYTEEDLLSNADRMEQVKKALDDAKIEYDVTDASDMVKKYNAIMEHKANVKQMSTESGYSAVEALKEVAGGSTEHEDIAAAVAQMYGDIYNEKQQAELVKTTEDLLKQQADWKDANERFQKSWQDATSNVPSNSSPAAFINEFIRHKDNITYSDLSKSLEGFSSEGNNVEYAVDENGLPMLKYSGSHMYDPDYWKAIDGKFKTGLDYVPMNDYLALLHEGESVLTKSEAEDYRKLKSTDFNSLTSIDDIIANTIQATITNTIGTGSSLDTSSITGSVNTQTDKLVEILTKILQVLTGRTGISTSSNLPKSLMYLNSDVSLM